jgi:hypothetical protein
VRESVPGRIDDIGEAARNDERLEAADSLDALDSRAPLTVGKPPTGRMPTGPALPPGID